MKNVKIIDNSDIIDETLLITSDNLLKLIENRGLMVVLSEYSIPESFLLEHKFDKEIVIECLNLSESFILESLDCGYFDQEDIRKISTTTISNLSEEFILKFSEFINWNKLMIYLLASEKMEDIEKYQSLIDEKNLWDIVSCDDLPIEFIRKNKDKINWGSLSICRTFDDAEKIEFENYLPIISEIDESLIPLPRSKWFKKTIQSKEEKDLKVTDIQNLISTIIKEE